MSSLWLIRLWGVKHVSVRDGRQAISRLNADVIVKLIGVRVVVRPVRAVHVSSIVWRAPIVDVRCPRVLVDEDGHLLMQHGALRGPALGRAVRVLRVSGISRV